MAGFTSVTGQESMVYADNASFDGTQRGGAMTTNSQLWIGSTAAPHVRVGGLTSTSGSVTISYVAPNINIEVTGATTSVQTLTGDSGGPINPTAGNINTIGSGSITIAGSAGSNLTMQLTGLTSHAVLVGAGTSTITKVGPTATAGQIFQSGGAAADPVFSTATYPATATGTGTILRADGTNWVATTATYPATTTVSQLLYSSSTNVVAGLSTANNGTLITGTTGVPVVLANGTTGQVLTATTGSPPSWVAPATAGTVTTVSVVSANGFAGTVATATSTPAITLTTTVTGVLSGNGTTISGSAVTQYDVLVGGASNAVSSVGPGSAGQVLQSAGNASNPAYSTATYPATTTASQLLYSSATNVVGGLATANSAVLTTTSAGVPGWSGTMTNGQLIIGSTTATPTAATLTAGTGISITNGAGSITVNAVGTGLTWTAVTGSTQAMTSNNGYIANRSGTVAFSLPTTSAVGDVVAVTGINSATGWSIAYTTNQQIFFGSSTATLTSGSLASTAIRDTVYLVCMTANLTWNVVSSIGNITVA